MGGFELEAYFSGGFAYAFKTSGNGTGKYRIVAHFLLCFTGSVSDNEGRFVEDVSEEVPVSQ
jgi:hypothetical protein